jgi:hypothetical protein
MKNLKSVVFPKYIQGDSYSSINILTSGRFRSQKALDKKILSHKFSNNSVKILQRFFFLSRSIFLKLVSEEKIIVS